jgi:NADH-quinone oxidoreductase subunit E
MLRRLYHDQPAAFAFTPENRAWAEAQITKYPEGRQASAIIPLLWRAQEQEGWLTRRAIEHVADMLAMSYIRALEVATFYFMFQLQPTGAVAHFQICGTTPCMLRGSEDLIAVCKSRIAPKAHQVSTCGKFSWEEVECLGACANAPMAQIGKDYYEDLTPEGFAAMIDAFAAGEVPKPGPQNGRFASEPASGLTSLKDRTGEAHNGSVARALDIGDTIKRIDGTEVPLRTPWREGGKPETPPEFTQPIDTPVPAQAEMKGRPAEGSVMPESTGNRPETLIVPRASGPDDLKKIDGVGPKLEKLLNSLGFFHYDQIANWTESDIAWVDENLATFRGRVNRDGWVEQARRLAAKGETDGS